MLVVAWEVEVLDSIFAPIRMQVLCAFTVLPLIPVRFVSDVSV